MTIDKEERAVRVLMASLKLFVHGEMTFDIHKKVAGARPWTSE
jgi:hypothetical protein